MPEEQPPRPKRFQTATERDLGGLKRRRTEPGGVPQVIDFENTPPPADPALLHNVPEEIEWARRLAQASKQNAEAIAHEQKVRREGEAAGREWGALTEKVGTLAEAVNKLDGLENLSPKIDKLGHTIEKLVIADEVRKARDEDNAAQLERLFREHGIYGERVNRAEQTTALTDQRVKALEANVNDRIGTVERRVGAVETKTNALETHRKISVALTRREQAKAGGWGAAAGAIASALAWLAQHFFGG